MNTLMIPAIKDIDQAGLKALPAQEIAQLPSKMRRLEDISLAVILTLLAERGALSQDSGARTSEQIIAELGAAPRHQWLVRRWLVALVGREFICLQDGQYRYSDKLVLNDLETADALTPAYRELGFPPEMAQAHLTLIDSLGDLISDKTTINDLLFQQGDVLAALAAYQSNWFTGYLNQAAAFVINTQAVWRAKSGQKPKMLTLLELGGGAGLTTSAVLGELKGRPINYRFTDVSPLFTKSIQKIFRHQIGLRCSLLDINVDFAQQAIKNESIDVVVAGNVLHNAANIGDSLQRIRAALKPGGVLIFTESVRENHAMLTAMQFLLSPADGQPLLGCEVGNEDRRAADEHLFIDAKGWREELTKAGFELALSLPEDEQSPLAAAGQALFVAVATDVTSVADIDLDLLETQLNQQLASAFEQVDLHQAVRVTDALNYTALLSMLNAFSRVGLFTNSEEQYSLEQILAQPPVAENHQPLIRRWLKVLVEEHLLNLDERYYQLAIEPALFSDDAMNTAWTTLGEDWQSLSGAQQTIEYAKDNAEQLPALIRGEVQAVHLLFPRGNTQRASALYREGVAARYQQYAVRDLLQQIISHWQASSTIKILEVGAGTGATTEGMLPMLDELSQKVAIEYRFTDVSSAFADSFFAKHKPAAWLKRGIYDIDAAPSGQGVLDNSVDVVVAGGVFNAARDTDVSLGWIQQILRPGGWFIMTEPTDEEFWVMASQAFMLQHAEDDRAEAQATFLSLAQWHQALAGSGLQLVLDLPPASHPLSKQGHRVFALRKAVSE